MTTSKASSSASPNPDSLLDDSVTFSESAETLDTIIDQFKSGTLSLEDSLTLFEHGVSHLKNCQAKLTQAHGKVEVLVKTLKEHGEMVTEPFGEDA